MQALKGAGVDIDEDSGVSVSEQLRHALTKNMVRVIDLFREWDENGDGTVSKQEFQRAMPMLGLHAPREEVALLFDSWVLGRHSNPRARASLASGCLPAWDG